MQKQFKTSEKQRIASRLANQRRYAERKAKGLCIYCDEPADVPHVRCSLHREIVSDYSAGKRDIRKVKGLCADCGKCPPSDGKFSCSECRAKWKLRNKIQK